MEIYGMLGERLGTIGKAKDKDEDQSPANDTPQWKKDFLKKPSISVRKGIAWRPEQVSLSNPFAHLIGLRSPYEDTDTLVLTSPNSVFVDIRFPVKRQLGKPLASDPSFWAFCGSASTTFLTGGSIDMPYSAHCVWRHEVDSKGLGITDEGDMFLLPNGDCMEVGMMQNPKTDKVEMYKEYWTIPAPVQPSNAAGRLRLTPCIVAKTIDLLKDHELQETTIRNGSGGVIIRIGSYCQGIKRQQLGEDGGRATGPDAIMVERWTSGLVEAPRNSSPPAAWEPCSDAAGWGQDWRSNTPSDRGVSMPCMWVCDDNRKLGDEIVVGGMAWRIVEIVAKKDDSDEA